MSDGDDLRGWQSHFYGETQPAFAAGSTVTAVAPAVTWSLTGGVISAAISESDKAVSSQSLLRYQRPLLDGESISYEFEYSTAEALVHPALGRMAFLIESGGVKVRWLTDGANEWTGLPADNALLEPLSRRGPRPLPLKEGAWNIVKLARAGGKVSISLNDEAIYQRVVDFGGDHKFGFYRGRGETAAKIRNVIMTGDWPETLPADVLQNPTVTVDLVAN